MNSRIVTVEIEAEVFFDVVKSLENTDADGNRGIMMTELVPRTVQILTKVPKECEAWLKAAAIDAFEEKN